MDISSVFDFFAHAWYNHSIEMPDEVISGVPGQRIPGEWTIHMASTQELGENSEVYICIHGPLSSCRITRTRKKWKKDSKIDTFEIYGSDSVPEEYGRILCQLMVSYI